MPSKNTVTNSTISFGDNKDFPPQKTNRKVLARTKHDPKTRRTGPKIATTCDSNHKKY
jgi:hypothetical protein